MVFRYGNDTAALSAPQPPVTQLSRYKTAGIQWINWGFYIHVSRNTINRAITAKPRNHSEISRAIQGSGCCRQPAGRLESKGRHIVHDIRTSQLSNWYSVTAKPTYCGPGPPSLSRKCMSSNRAVHLWGYGEGLPPGM
jgi:hypothetical protein